MVYAAYRGAIPEGKHIDHLCRNRRCVNPDHMEAVTLMENTQRGKTAKLTTDLVRLMRSYTPTFTSKYAAACHYANALAMHPMVTYWAIIGKTWKNAA